MHWLKDATHALVKRCHTGVKKKGTSHTWAGTHPRISSLVEDQHLDIENSMKMQRKWYNK
jgi:hypothetical protein